MKKWREPAHEYSRRADLTDGFTELDDSDGRYAIYYVYVCMYVCMHVRMHASMYVCITYVCMYTYVCNTYSYHPQYVCVSE